MKIHIFLGMIAHRAVLVIIAGVFFLNSWATGSYSPSSFSVSGVALACADELEVIAQSEFWPFVKKHFKDRGLKLTEADYNDLEKWLKVVSGKNLAGEHQTKQNTGSISYRRARRMQPFISL